MLPLSVDRFVDIANWLYLKNVIPIVEDARHPLKYRVLVPSKASYTACEEGESH